ncbi:MAG: hypothetical protein M0C28_14945 [Candidatus Moduliflexus flocculans]|nr:hypothetical protein [Candidatus Moduliflexus flocculans]
MGLPDGQRHRQPPARCTEVCEPAGLVIVLEPLNPKDHPGLFLTKIPQAYQICRAVNSPSLQDPRRHVPPADHRGEHHPQHRGRPGTRSPPSTSATTRAARSRRRARSTTGTSSSTSTARATQGVLGMEHGKSKPGQEGERAVIDAYRACDAFLKRREATWTRHTTNNGTSTRAGFHQDGRRPLRWRCGHPRNLGRALRPGLGRAPDRRHRLRRPRHRARPSTASTASPGVEIVALGDLVPGPGRELAQDGSRRSSPAGSRSRPSACFTGFDDYQKVCAVPEVNLIVTRRPARLPARSTSRPRSRPASTSSWRSPWPSTRSASARSSPPRSWPRQKGLGIVAGTQRRHQQRYLELDEARSRTARSARSSAAQCYWNQGDLWVMHTTTRRDERDGVAVPQLALLHLDLGRPHRRAARPQHRRRATGPSARCRKTSSGMGGRAGPDGARVRQHLRPLRRRVRVPERRPGRQHAAARPRAAPTGSRSGSSAPRASPSATARSSGEKPWKFEGEETNPYVLEHADLIARDPVGQAAQRGPADRREHDVRHHGPDERLHRPGHLLGLGHERLEARPLPAKLRVRPEPGRPPSPSRA